MHWRSNSVCCILPVLNNTDERYSLHFVGVRLFCIEEVEGLSYGSGIDQVAWDGTLRHNRVYDISQHELFSHLHFALP